MQGEFADLVVGARFDDEENEPLLAYEELCNEDTTRNYWIPTFRQLIRDRIVVSPVANPSEPPAVLSLGCGTGVDVDLLAKEGYSAYGVDCGNRSSVWHRRSEKERLVMANGMNLPFEDNSFDVAFCGCVFPHVGVIGDSNRVSPNYHDDRLRLAREMTRVVRPGGRIVVSSPNRWFPLDLFHGRATGSYRTPMNWPSDPFLLSRNDYVNLFREAGCQNASLLPNQNYWGFIRARNSLKGKVFSLPVRFLFWLVSQNSCRFLRATSLNPWIIVSLTK